LANTYSFSEYSPEWPHQFEREAGRLRQLLGDELVEIHHIGSTSVPGLAAKPIIDCLPLVRDIQRILKLIPTMEAAGYHSWGVYGILGRQLFTKEQDNVRTHNIHIFQVGAAEVDRHLVFRDYLRRHRQVRDEYEALKREVYRQHPTDIHAYAEGKDTWIKKHEQLALAWWRKGTFAG